MLVLQKEDHGAGMFYIDIHNETLAKMVYTMESPHRMIINYTEVEVELSGKNTGYQLVHAAVEYAREHNIKIVPICPFAKSVFEKKAEFVDVLNK